MVMSRRHLMSSLGFAGAGVSLEAVAGAHPGLPTDALATGFVGIGLAVDAVTLSVPADAVGLVTGGYTRFGVGAACYMLNPSVRHVRAAGRLVVADGRCFDLLPPIDGVSPQMFGALADYDPVAGTGTDDSTAFSDCVDFCMARPGDRAWPMALHGHYLVTRNNMLADRSQSPHGKQGYAIRGRGTANSCITWRPAAERGVDHYYFRDGLSAAGTASVANVMLDFQLSDFTLYLDARNLRSGQTLSGFRMSGWNVDPAPEQAWAWRDFRIQGDAAHLDRNGAALRIVGDANGSEVSLVRCAGQYLASAIACTNAQAVNHSVVNSNFELMTGAIFDYVRGGGLTVVAGSYIVGDFDGPARGPVIGDPVLFSIGGDGSGQINDFLMLGSRIELRSTRAKIFTGGDLNTASTVRLAQVNCAAVAGKHRPTFVIAESALSITIDGGSWTSPPGYAEPIMIRFSGGPDTAYVHRGSGPRILLAGDIRVSRAIHDLVAWGSDASTGIVQLGEHATCDPTRGESGEVAYAVADIHVPATLTNPAAKGFVAKGTAGPARRTWPVNFYAWPDAGSGGAYARFTLPPGAVLLGVRAVRQAAPGPREAARLVVVNDQDGSLVASFPAIADFSVGFDVRTPNLRHHVRPSRRTFRVADQAARDRGLRQTGVGDMLLIDFLA